VKGCVGMSRKIYSVKDKHGRPIRVSVGVKSKERLIDPTGFLTQSSSSGLNAEEQKAFSEWKAKAQTSSRS
jgi:hypothetical protein